MHTISLNPFNSSEFITGASDCFVRLFDLRLLTARNSVMDSTASSSYCDGDMKFAPTHLTTKPCNVQVTGVAYSKYNPNEFIASYNHDKIYLFNSVENYISDADRRSWTSNSPAVDTSYSMLFEGHQNLDTIKAVNYFGPRSEFVVSGSDCGHVFIWDAQDGRLLQLFKADNIGAVNAIEQPHDINDPLLCSSGLQNSFKVWKPSSYVSTVPSDDYIKRIMEGNSGSGPSRRNSRRNERLMEMLSNSGMDIYSLLLHNGSDEVGFIVTGADSEDDEVEYNYALSDNSSDDNGQHE